MKKKALVVFVFLFIVLLIWYLFVKPNDYQVNFTAHTFPGTINQSIKTWGKEQFAGKVVEQSDLYHIRQQFQFGDSILDYEWNIVPLTDSTSKVRVKISDKQHGFMNKILIPFSNTIMEKRSKKTLLNYSRFLDQHIKNFKVSINGKAVLDSSFCAYLSNEGVQSQKAFGMMRDFPYLSGFVSEENLQPTGTPFVEITHWNTKTDSISFNFCYPIVKTDSLPEHREIKYKFFPSRKTLKATYNGNYITSDRAWYKLMDYAEKEGYRITKNPIEIFYDNPSLGGNELEWKAEIYMPIVEKNE